MTDQAAIEIRAGELRLEIGRPVIEEHGIGSYWVTLDYLGSRFVIDNCVLWPGSSFADEMQVLYDNLKGSASYLDMDKQFSLELKATEYGHIAIKVGLYKSGGAGALAVTAEGILDQSFLPPIIAAWRRDFVTGVPRRR